MSVIGKPEPTMYQQALPKLEAYLMGGASVTLDARGVRVDPPTRTTSSI